MNGDIDQNYSDKIAVSSTYVYCLICQSYLKMQRVNAKLKNYMLCSYYKINMSLKLQLILPNIPKLVLINVNEINVYK